MYLRGHYQNAYVTHDVDKAMKLVGDRYGKIDWIVFEPDLILRTPQGEKQSSVKAALGWVGGLQLELIQPGAGYQDHYLEFLPEDKSDASLRFNHIAVRRDDLDAMRAEIEQLGLPVIFEGEVPGLVYVYLDARESLGHYLEYVWASPEGWEMMAWPDDRTVA